MFGSDIIRIKVKGYLRNITDNEIFEFEERGIKNKDKITFNNNDIKYSIKCNDNEIMMWDSRQLKAVMTWKRFQTK